MTAFRLCLIATLALGALASAAPPLDLAEEVAMEAWKMEGHTGIPFRARPTPKITKIYAYCGVWRVAVWQWQRDEHDGEK